MLTGRTRWGSVIAKLVGIIEIAGSRKLRAGTSCACAAAPTGIPRRARGRFAPRPRLRRITALQLTVPYYGILHPHARLFSSPLHYTIHLLCRAHTFGLSEAIHICHLNNEEWATKAKTDSRPHLNTTGL